MYQITICQYSDIPELLAVAKTSFIEAFEAKNTKEAMEGYMTPAFRLEKWQEEFENPHSEFYLLKENDTIIGYLKVNFHDAQCEYRDADGMEIERVYILEKHHGTGCGQMLLDKALAIAKERNMHYVWLGVWERNPKAQRFYEKNGFVLCGSHVFMMGEEAQTDLLMKRELV